MIKTITVTNYLNESIVLELGAPEKSGLLIKSITGLGPVKADINMTNIASSDGSLYNSSRATYRNITMKLGLMFAPTIEDSRLKTYKYFPIKKKIKLTIETDNRICECYGYVESNEPDIFSKSETVNISIICPDPYFYSVNKELVTFYGVEKAFEFPFSNESLTDDLIEFGHVTTNTRQTIYYTGDAEVGITIIIHAIGKVTNLTIWNVSTRESMHINDDKLITIIGSGIDTADDIIITTLKNSKSIQLFRNGIYTNILNCLDRNTDWFKISKGDNIFAFTSDYGNSNMEMRIEYQNAYEGV